VIVPVPGFYFVFVGKLFDISWQGVAFPDARCSCAKIDNALCYLVLFRDIGLWAGEPPVFSRL
jgi:hypothetical protein